MELKNTYIPAVRLTFASNGDSFFEKGRIIADLKINSEHIFFANEIDSWQIGAHIAPRRQFVVTLHGKLKFMTSDNLSFILEPGIVLLAEDISGKGHRWEMIDGHTTWQRIYIPVTEETKNLFVKD